MEPTVVWCLITLIIIIVALFFTTKIVLKVVESLEEELDLLEEELSRLEDKLLENGVINLVDAIEIKE